MEQHAVSPALAQLQAFIGEWTMQAAFPDAPPTDTQGRTAFEWMTGGQFLIQRWEVPLEGAPDGIAIIGADPNGDAYLQHYFDSRGVARVYEMGFARGVWALSRSRPDFAPLDFWQRFSGTFGADGNTIAGRWEASQDEGASWEHDFDLIYSKVT
jgi:hypothetical protein